MDKVRLFFQTFFIGKIMLIFDCTYCTRIPWFFQLSINKGGSLLAYFSISP
jgi:hypothetical protein